MQLSYINLTDELIFQYAPLFVQFVMKKLGYDAVISCICNDNTAVVSHYYHSIHEQHTVKLRYNRLE